MAAKQPFLTAEELKDVLECPVCLRIPRSAPIFQCERGHVVCSFFKIYICVLLLSCLFIFFLFTFTEIVYIFCLHFFLGM